MKIAFFLSDHGYGHVMRNVAVIEEVSKDHEVIVVTGERQAELAKQYLANAVTYIPMHTDTGLVVQSGSLKLDHEATINKIAEDLKNWPEQIAFAKSLGADRFVVDIVPWALIAAKELGIPSYLMASFTWMEQYEGFVPKQYLDEYAKAFRKADQVLYYDLVNEPTRKLLGNGTDVGFVARPFHEKEVESIRKEHKQKIVYLSLGGSNSGLDYDIDVSKLPYDFITTSALHLTGDNVTYIPSDVSNTQDYVKAADFCIAKAGWTTVSEMMLSGNPFAVLERPDTPEDTMIIEELVKRKAAISVTTEDLLDMSKVMQRMESQTWSDKEYKNQFELIAKLVVE